MTGLLSPSGEITPEVGNIVLSGISSGYIQVSGVALLFYDILVTMDREVRQVWTRRHAATTVMYIAARYSCVLGHVTVILTGTGWSGQNIQTCSAVYWLGSLSSALSLLAVASFSAIRMFVLSRKSYWASLVVFMFGLYPSVMYIYFPTLVTPKPSNACDFATTIPMTTYRMEAMSTRIGSVAADLPVLLVTLRHTYRTFLSGRQTLSQILLVDGSMYFGALFLLSFAEIIFLAVAMPNLPEPDPDLKVLLSAYFVSVSGALGSLATTINVVLMCRFLLHLCEASEAGPNRNTPSTFTSVSFTSAMLTGHLSEDDECELEVLERRTPTVRALE